MKIFTFLLSLLSTFILSGQDLFEVGSSWTHCYIASGSNPGDRGEVRLSCDISYTNNGLEHYGILIKSKPNGFPAVDGLVVAVDGEKVYYREKDQLYLLYDFSLTAGQSYTLRYPLELDPTFLQKYSAYPKSVTVTIDSVTTVTLNGRDYKRQYISTNGPDYYQLGSYVQQYTGFEKWIFPLFSLESENTRIMNGLIKFGIHFYNYTNPEIDCTKLSNNGAELEQQFSIYPNPSTDKLYWSNTSNINIKRVSVVDMLGKTSFTKEAPAFSEIDINSLKPGYYAICLYTDSGIIRQLFLKQ